MPRRIVVDESRDTQELRGKRIDHFKLCKDYLCGECGGKLVLKHYSDAPHWRTRCSDSPGHDPQQFIHRAAYERQQAEKELVFDALPEGFKAILKGEQN